MLRPVLLRLGAHDASLQHSWEEFAKPDAPVMNFVFTVCDNAAGEICPVWPGHPIAGHWGVDDPAAVKGTDREQRRAFHDTLHELEFRVKAFVSLPIESLGELALKQKVAEIGKAHYRAG